MELKCDSAEFSEILSVCQGISERRATMPVLSHVLINAESESIITATVTDLETTLEARSNAQIYNKGSIALPAKKLFEIIREIPQGEVEIKTLDNNWVYIKSNAVSFKLAGLPAVDFPTTPTDGLLNETSIETEILEDMISKTIFAIATDELRRNLAGIYIEPQKGESIRVVGTDGHRLSYVEKNISNKLNIENGVILPRKGVMELKKLLKAAQDMRITIGNSFLTASIGKYKIYIRLIEQEYPDYRQVIPQETKSTIIIKKQDILNSLKRVSILSSEKTKSIKMIIDNSKIELIAITPEVGEAREEIEVDYSGEKIELGFNSTYIIDVLEAIGEEMITLNVTDELSPALIKPLESEDYLSVIMPMRV